MDTMALGVIVELVALAVALMVGIAAVYVIFEMRTVYSDHQEKFVRVVTSVEAFQKRMESDSRALQEVAMQIERVVAELNTTIPESALGAAERQGMIVTELRNHLDHQESKLAEIAQHLADDVRSLQEFRRQPEHSNGNGEYVRLSRDILANDSQLRFSLLKDWLAINTLAITRRACRPWTSPMQLIIGVPESLEAEAELQDGMLLVGTRGLTEKIAVPVTAPAEQSL
ncbi:MAG: hypothetical protein HY646_01690 [Acidobacteria bacterium]|nr:hypothetical protein [Acidobacteriota bacterium]